MASIKKRKGPQPERKGQANLLFARPFLVSFLRTAIAAAAACAGNDVFFQHVEIAKINNLDFQFHIFHTELHP
jgi:hypothetical protein